MFFRNLTMFRFPTSLHLADLPHALPECAAKPVGPLELSSRGFVPPMGQHHEGFSHRIGNAIWITIGGEDKILPAAAVNAELAKRLQSYEERNGRKPGARARKSLKDEVLLELLPRALVKPYRIDAFMDLRRGLLVVDTASRKAADGVVCELRRALGSFPALPLNAEVAPRAVLTGWLAGDGMPEGVYDGDKSIGGALAITDEAELRDPADGGSVVRCQRQDLHGDEVRKHIEAGKQCSRLGLALDGRITFAFGEDLVVRKLKLLEGVVEALDSVEHEDVRAELDARFALLTGEIGHLFDVLERAFKLSKADA